MNKNVCIISSSPRKGGNSETLCQMFAKGAKETGNQVVELYLYEKLYIHALLAIIVSHIVVFVHLKMI